MSIAIERVNALAELEALGWGYESVGDAEVRCRCPDPEHSDNTPSATLNTEKNLWRCHSCGAKGDILTFLALALKVNRETVIVKLGERYDLDDIRAINPETIEQYHGKLFTEGAVLLKPLRERGVTDEMIRAARLGFHSGRITIPVYDERRNVVNVRRYLPGAPSHQKMTNTRGYGKLRLYQVEDLKYDRVIIAGGEIKALVTGYHTRPHGIGCVSATGGEGSWDSRWSTQLRGKTVYVCMDVDLTGRAAARRLCNLLRPHVSDLHVIPLPLDKTRYPKGDLNDYFAAEGGTCESLLAAAVSFSAEGQITDAVDIKEVTLEHAITESNVRKRVTFEAVLCAMDKTPYLVPKDVRISCDRNQKNCSVCPVYGYDQSEDFVELQIPSVSDGLLDMIDTKRKGVDAAVRSCLGIPPCKSCQITVRTHYSLTDVRLTPQLSLQSHGTANDVNVPAVIVGEQVDLNVPYRFGGILYPSPRTQQAVLTIDEVDETADSLDTFDPTEDELTELCVFQTEEQTVDGIRAKLNELYADIETNITRIFCRRELHLLVDLAYHSVLLLDIDDRRVPGWVNVLVIGDSAQGKTEMTTRMLEHYQLGERVDCKNASVAGLLGGLQQMIGNRWFVSWGVIPTHDRRLVMLEEIKGADPIVIGKLTDMRSSGIAEIPKIERRRANARTRLVFISNPRNGKQISAYGYGTEAIRELIGSQEDVRRFDAAIVLAQEQIGDSVRLTRKRKSVAHTYTSELCRRLILYAWTRDARQVRFSADALTALRKMSDEMCSIYSENLPLVDKGTMRLKLARLSAALAARLFSTGKSLETLQVHEYHVQFVCDFLDKMYTDKFFGYRTFSKTQHTVSYIHDPQLVIRHLSGSKYPRDLANNLLSATEITREDIQDWCDIDVDEARKTLSLLVRKHCLFRDGRQTYRKTAAFVELLKEADVAQHAEILEEDEL